MAKPRQRLDDQIVARTAVETAFVSHEDDPPDARPGACVDAVALLLLLYRGARALAAVAAAAPAIVEPAAAEANME